MYTVQSIYSNIVVFVVINGYSVELQWCKQHTHTSLFGVLLTVI
jgi:hypothetical protein